MKIDLVNYLKEYFNMFGYRLDLLSLKEYLPLKLQSLFSDNIGYDVMKKVLIEFDINDIDNSCDETKKRKIENISLSLKSKKPKHQE